MHRSVAASVKQLLMEVHHIDYEDAGKAIMELQTQRLVLLEKLTHAFGQVGTESARAEALQKEIGKLERQKQELQRELQRFTSNPTVTGPFNPFRR